MLLAAIYAQDFFDGSYGFWPGRSPHDTMQALRERCRTQGIGWSVDADVRGSCDSMDRPRLREVLRHRVKDGRIVRLLGQWLHAGVWEEGGLHHPDPGVVQGGTIAPVLATSLLHQVLDAWLEHAVQPRLKGRSVLIRCADDVVIGCELDADARTSMAVLPKRFARDGLTIHPPRTALMACRKPAGH
jgi:retron-type reverse transcriptase